MRLAPRSVLVALAALALLVPAAGAHLVGPQGVYRSSVTSITPSTLPIKATVRFGDSDIRIENLGSKTLTLFDYSIPPRPYATIGPRGVYVNHNTDAYYLNDDRYGNAKVPDGTGTGPPKFVRYSALPSFTYHDHRTHWMSKDLPKTVDSGNPRPQKVFDWTVPVKYGDTPGKINGTLLYVGGQKPLDWVETVGTAAALLAMLAAFAFEARRRRARAREQGTPAAAVDEASASTPEEAEQP